MRRFASRKRQKVRKAPSRQAYGSRFSSSATSSGLLTAGASNPWRAPPHGKPREAAGAAASIQTRVRRVSFLCDRGTRDGMTPRRTSTTHGPRLDDALDRETKPLQHGASGARAQEDREPEAPFPEEGGPGLDAGDVQADPALARRELSRHVRMTVFPAGRNELVAEAEANQAPPWVLRLLRMLPEDARFDTVYEVWDAAGGELEPGVHDLISEREHEGEAES
jgi:hypothetical protein